MNDYVIVLYDSTVDQEGGEIGGIRIKARDETRAEEIGKRFLSCYFTIKREYNHANE